MADTIMCLSLQIQDCVRSFVTNRWAGLISEENLFMPPLKRSKGYYCRFAAYTNNKQMSRLSGQQPWI